MIEIEEQAEVAAQELADTAKVEPTPGHRPQGAVPPGGPQTPKPKPKPRRVADGAPGIRGEDWPPPPAPPGTQGAATTAAPSGAMATREQPTALVPTMPAPLAETATTAAAAQAKAAVEARYLVAWRNPRSDDAVRGKLLRECQRPRFAKVAEYERPIGGGKSIKGPSIRFAEAAMRCMGNMLPEAYAIYDDDDKRIVRVSVTDLEANVTHTKDIVVTKTVERRSLRRGQEAVSSRTNSTGQTTHTVRASEDDLLNKEGALISKAMRTCALRLIPGDLVDEAMDLCRATASDHAAKDPDAARKEIADAFAQLNVTAADLEKYLGHDLSKCSPAQLADLRALYAAVRDGETTWAAVLEASGASTAPSGTGTDGLKAALGKKS
ncbi:MAG TPA: hypothetical protein ENH89_19980 [Aurantimonas coralicida]|nr:hypothetical protein [Aurantimonas coralicida]